MVACETQERGYLKQYSKDPIPSLSKTCSTKLAAAISATQKNPFLDDGPDFYLEKEEKRAPSPPASLTESLLRITALVLCRAPHLHSRASPF